MGKDGLIATCGKCGARIDPVCKCGKRLGVFGPMVAERDLLPEPEREAFAQARIPSKEK